MSKRVEIQRFEDAWRQLMALNQLRAMSGARLPSMRTLRSTLSGAEENRAAWHLSQHEFEEVRRNVSRKDVQAFLRALYWLAYLSCVDGVVVEGRRCR